MKKSRLTKFMLLIAVCLIAASATAFAEGSKELTANSLYRPYLEWFNSTTAGVKRINKIKVFAKAGETLQFGSSVTNAQSDNGAVEGKDITVIFPNGDSQTFDVLPTGEGYINTVEKEKIGPDPENGGYTPFEMKVQQTGIYTFEFRSNAASVTVTGNNSNPTAVLSTADFTKAAANTGVSAWDVTVRNNQGNIVTGRMWADYIALNIGKNIDNSMTTQFYVLTNDGYKYKVNFNNADPYGFILFANNRGFIDSKSNTSLYRTVIALNNQMTSLVGGVTLLYPSGENTATNITHKIFLNDPASDLPDSIPTVAQKPAQVTDFYFEGSAKGETGKGNGGTFYIDLSKDTTYTINIDIDNDGIINNNDVVLSNAAVKGMNSIYWDGKDLAGNIVAEGTYSVTVNAKGGEYHFPMLDIENINGGINIQLLNAPYMPEGFSTSTIYYNDEAYTTASGTTIDTRKNYFEGGKSQNAYISDMITPSVAQNGIDSLQDNVLGFLKAYGNQKGLDIWTCFPGDKASTQVVVKPELPKFAVVSGYVFFDKNKNGSFDANEEPLSNVGIEITDADKKVTTVTTDEAGHYNANIAIGAYTVKVVSVPATYVLTTKGADSQTGEAVSGAEYMDNIGYYLAIDVGTVIETEKTEYNVGDTAEFEITAYNNCDVDATNVVVSAALPANTELISTTAQNFDIQTGDWNIGTLKAGERKHFTVTVKLTAEGGYAYPSFISATDDIKESNNQSRVSYNVKNIVSPDTGALTTETLVYTKPVLNNNYAYIFGRSDANMMAYDYMYRGEACAVLYRLMKQNEKLVGNYVYDKEAAPAFKDIKGRWDRSSIEYLASCGAFSDKTADDNIFPDRNVKRREAFKLICLGLGFTTDSTKSDGYYAAILVDAKFLQGDGTGDIKLDDPIKRSEFCELYNKIIGRNNAVLRTKDGEEISPATYGFKDFTEDNWFYGTMLRATSAYDDEGYVSVEKRGIRNNLDDYDE